MPYMQLLCRCVACKVQMTCNPNKVPSIRVDGVREPLCRSCAERINANRKAQGLSECPIHPEAYEPEEY